MLVSHKHRFIFVKTRKTAGTSIEIALSRYCGPEDIITPIAAEDEAIRARVGVVPQNYVIENASFGRKRGTRSEEFWNHMPAALIRAHIGRRAWRSYFKFCFVRNPWDQAASFQRWANRDGGRMSLAEIIDRPLPIPNWQVYTIDGRIAMDFVGRYECLEDDLAEACRTIGLPYDGWLPHAKQTSAGTDYRTVFTPDLEDAVRQKHVQEITAFGYSFESRVSRLT